MEAAAEVSGRPSQPCLDKTQRGECLQPFINFLNLARVHCKIHTLFVGLLDDRHPHHSSSSSRHEGGMTKKSACKKQQSLQTLFVRSIRVLKYSLFVFCHDGFVCRGTVAPQQYKKGKLQVKVTQQHNVLRWYSRAPPEHAKPRARQLFSRQRTWGDCDVASSGRWSPCWPRSARSKSGPTSWHVVKAAGRTRGGKVLWSTVGRPFSPHVYMFGRLPLSCAPVPRNEDGVWIFQSFVVARPDMDAGSMSPFTTKPIQRHLSRVQVMLQSSLCLA